MTNKLYFYTFPAYYEDQIDLSRSPMLKIGETIQDEAIERVNQQMGTATPQKPDLKRVFQTSFTDHQFHRFLLDQGFERPNGKGTEWFYITVEKAEELITEFAKRQKDGIYQPIRAQLDPRPYQQDFADQFCSTDGDFLLFAKCRSGKSVMGMMAATQADFKSLLVVSLRTSAANSWLSDPKTFTVFHEWDVIDLHDSDAADRIKRSQAEGRRTLMVGTVQGADDKYPLKAKLKRLFPNGIDAMFLDECHIGGLSQTVKTLKDSISFGRVLEISGTAFKASFFYSKDNTFVWDYNREQASGLGMPKMSVTLVNYNANELKRVYTDEPDRFSNLFTVIDGKWQDEASVRNFFTGYFTHGTVHKRKQLLRNSNHIVMSLPSVAACELAVKTLKALNLPWAPMCITGNSGNNQASIRKHVQAKANPQTICFTRWANVVGVTIKEWDTVIHGAKTNSAEFYIQFSLRAGSTDRKFWRVIDFNPEQTVSSIVEMLQATSNADELEEPGNLLKTFLEFADINEFDDGFTTLGYEELLQITVKNPEEAIEGITRRASRLGRIGIYSDRFAILLSGATATKGVKVVDEVVNSNGTDDKGNQKITGEKRESTANERKAALKLVKGACERIPAVVATHVFEGEAITSVFQLLASPHLEMMTGLSREGFETAVEDHWLSNRELSALVADSALKLEAMAV